MLLPLVTIGLSACGAISPTELTGSANRQETLRSADNELLDMANRVLLDKDFKVYTNGSMVINHPAPGFVEKVLPTNNDFSAAPGCYMACYSHNPDQAVYSVGENVFVVGQVRVAGSYEGRMCQPQSPDVADEVSPEQFFNNLCNRTFATACQDGCEAAGDTGGWFGIQGGALTLHSRAADLTTLANQTLLDREFKVFTDGQTVINHPAPGFEEKILPTNNDFAVAPGCYLACYSRNQENAVYGFGGDIFVMGQVRVAGAYNGRLCIPEGVDASADLSAMQTFKDLCNQHFAEVCQDGCWAGGDTGGFFGIP